MNNNKTSNKLGSMAGKVLSDPNSSKIQKSLAGSVLVQKNTTCQTGAKLEDTASKVLKSQKYNETTKSLAGSVMSQANKKR